MTSYSPSSADVTLEGIVDIQEDQTGRLIQTRFKGRLHPTDPFIPKEWVRRFGLKRGSYLTVKAVPTSRFPNPKVRFIETMDGLPLEERRKKMGVSQLTTIPPQERIKLEMRKGPMANRIIDLFCPIGKGQRGLIVAPPRTGKTTLLQYIARGVAENHPECKLIVLLVDERPEEVTDFKRCIDVELYASSNDESLESHIRIAELAISRAKRLVEVGTHVVLLMDSLTRLSRAHNAARSGTGRTMTGGLDVRALEKPRQLFCSARNTEEAGSLTLIASALIETGSKMDELIFQEFKGTGNMEMVLDRKLAELRIWPALNIAASGTRREELLLDPSVLESVQLLRRALANQKTVDVTENLINRLSKTTDNDAFLQCIKTGSLPLADSGNRPLKYLGI